MIVTSNHSERFLDQGGILHGKTQYQNLIDVPLTIRGLGFRRVKTNKKEKV